MQAQKYTDQGYRRTSRRFGMLSRIDREDWKQVMADTHVNGMEWVNSLQGSAEDHYRRCHSKDTIEVPVEIALKVPGSNNNQCGFVQKRR